MSAKKNELIKEAVADLLEDTTPVEWISWLYDQMTDFISRSYTIGMTEVGARELANRYHSLKHFFESVNNISQ